MRIVAGWLFIARICGAAMVRTAPNAPIARTRPSRSFTWMPAPGPMTTPAFFATAIQSMERWSVSATSRTRADNRTCRVARSVTASI